MENPIRMDDLVVPLFLETPTSENSAILWYVPCEDADFALQSWHPKLIKSCLPISIAASLHNFWHSCSKRLTKIHGAHVLTNT